MPRLTGTERERAIGMLQAGSHVNRVARVFHVHPSTISRLRGRLQASGSTSDRPRSGRPRVTTDRDDRRIRMLHLRDRLRSATVTAAETPGLHNNRISDQTVRNRLRQAGLHARRPYRGLVLTAPRRQQRMRWVITHGRWTINQWSQILFTDESRFSLSGSDGRSRVWRRRGERYSDACVVQRDRWGGPSVMVWGGISATHRTELHFIAGNLTGLRYRDEILRPVVVPFVRRYRLTLQHDNARPHVARVCSEYLQAENVDVLPWPAFSPDLSPIEHLWDILDRAIRARQPQPGNVQDLRQALVEEWNRIPQAQITRLVTSMRRRCTAVRDANGGHTRY